MIESRPEDDVDDEALSWAGEGTDPTLAGGVSRRRAPRTVRSAPTGGETRGADKDELPEELTEDEDGESEAEATAASSVLLVAIGVTAGLYLLSTIGWMITATRQNAAIAATFAGDALGGGLYALGLWLAVAAPVAWFTAVLLGTREARVRTRVLWFVAGLVLLAPLPFLKGA